ncbi:MAG: nucleoside triphosphate pyrophosphohydrolase [Rhodobacteraceae bacterium]|nr:nucleoside triphosphate pyrophosphohydrolase [Paracoccaceae bacterium]
MSRPLPRAESDRLCREGQGVARLLEIMARLRAPEGGCPWDIAQTFDSIAPYTIEEAHEVADAIARRAWEELPGELGDLLLQVVYHARMAEEEGRFDFADVVAAISDKMVARHPHVFGSAPGVATAEAQTENWEATKAAERAATGTRTGVLDGVALGLPALMRAVKLQKRAARVGFDWPEPAEVLDKLAEEARELVEARDTSANHREEEMGDLLFVMANLARHLDIDPEAALRRANAKFERRFRFIEESLDVMGIPFSDTSLAEMEALWQEAKRRERPAKG